MSIRSGEDLTLRGANVSGETVALKVGGDTHVMNVQDRHHADTQTWNANASVGAAVGVNQTLDPVFGVIANPTFSVGAQGSHGWDDSRSTVKQAGIDAGQSLTADLKGDVNLVGGHLVSESGAGSVKVGGQVTAIDVVDQRHKDGNSGGGNIGIKSDGLATASFSYGKDDQVHRAEVQHGTIAVKDLQAGGGIVGSLNREAGPVSSVTDDRKIAGSKMTVEVGDLLEHLKKKVKSKSDADDVKSDDGPSRPLRQAAPDDDGASAQRVGKPVQAEATGASPAQRGHDRYTQRVIVQQGDDAVTAQAAKNLANKHPDNTVLVTAGPDGKLAGLDDIPATGGKVKVQVVGHGDPESGKLGGADASTVADHVKAVKTQLGADAAVEKVTLVGCQTACAPEAGQPSLKDQVHTELAKQGTEVGEVKGRQDYVKVDDSGKKRPTTASDAGALGKTSSVEFGKNVRGPLSKDELNKIRSINDSIFCIGNCESVAERVAKYVTNRGEENIEIPSVAERFRTFGTGVKRGAMSILGRLDDGESGRGGLVLEGVSFSDIKRVVQESPGSHAIVSGEYPDRPWGHAFNLINQGDGVVIIDAYSASSFDRAASNMFGYLSNYDRNFDAEIFGVNLSRATRTAAGAAQKPAEATAVQRGEDRYAQRVIVQQGDDPVTTQAARNLANKHPDNTTLVKAGPDGKLAGLDDIPATGGKVKVQVVGHGDAGSGKLGGAEAPELARQVAQVKTQLGDGAAVEKVTLVGCQTACKIEAGQPSLKQQVQEELAKQGTDVGEVKGRQDYVKVDHDGHKHDTIKVDPDKLGHLKMYSDYIITRDEENYNHAGFTDNYRGKGEPAILTHGEFDKMTGGVLLYARGTKESDSAGLVLKPLDFEEMVQPEEFVRLMQDEHGVDLRLGGNTGDGPLRLIACCALKGGENSSAQKLANATGRRIYAYSDSRINADSIDVLDGDRTAGVFYAGNSGIVNRARNFFKERGAKGHMDRLPKKVVNPNVSANGGKVEPAELAPARRGQEKTR
ncbi:hypothetical protein J2785_007429 [Burkholderia ambifaria]|nr:C80 family cysteine peptidase [Burkholderia ambifaria]MDR6504231.1 hypothetical protein [Burkholderia ambifaria]